MAVIAFSDDPGKGWVVAGWAVRQVLDDVLSQHPNDSAMAAEFAVAKLTSGILVHSLEPDLAARVTKAIRDVATGILSGRIRSGIYDQPYGDAGTVEQYLAALKELLQIIPVHEGRQPE